MEFVLHLVTISLSQCPRVSDLVFKAFSCWLLPVFCFIFCSIPLGTITLGKQGCLLVAYCVCFYGSLLSDAFFTLHIPAVFMCEYCSLTFSFMCFSIVSSLNGKVSNDFSLFWNNSNFQISKYVLCSVEMACEQWLFCLQDIWDWYTLNLKYSWHNSVNLFASK